MVDFEFERTVNRSWMTAMLTGTAVNNPKAFPKSAAELIGKLDPKPVMSPDQWKAMIEMLVAAGANRKPSKPRKPKETSGS